MRRPRRQHESPWTARVCKHFEKFNAMTFAVVGGEKQKSGWPDRYVHHSYWSGWLEFKGETTTITALQIKIIVELNRRQPGCAFILRKCNESENGMLFDENGGYCGLIDLDSGNPFDVLKEAQFMKRRS